MGSTMSFSPAILKLRYLPLGLAWLGTAAFAALLWPDPHQLGYLVPLAACSGLALERSPLPDARAWQEIADLPVRLRRGLGELYGWYTANAELAACVLRDAETHPLTREINELRWGPLMTSYRDVLGVGMNPTQRALLHLALGFPAWRALVRDSGLSEAEAVDAMVKAVLGRAG